MVLKDDSKRWHWAKSIFKCWKYIANRHLGASMPSQRSIHVTIMSMINVSILK